MRDKNMAKMRSPSGSLEKYSISKRRVFWMTKKTCSWDIRQRSSTVNFSLKVMQDIRFSLAARAVATTTGSNQTPSILSNTHTTFGLQNNSWFPSFCWCTHVPHLLQEFLLSLLFFFIFFYCNNLADDPHMKCWENAEAVKFLYNL